MPEDARTFLQDLTRQELEDWDRRFNAAYQPVYARAEAERLTASRTFNLALEAAILAGDNRRVSALLQYQSVPDLNGAK